MTVDPTCVQSAAVARVLLRANAPLSWVPDVPLRALDGGGVSVTRLSPGRF